MGAADIRLRMATQDDAQTVASIITTVSEIQLRSTVR